MAGVKGRSGRKRKEGERYQSGDLRVMVPCACGGHKTKVEGPSM
jgi:hypothetical protein